MGPACAAALWAAYRYPSLFTALPNSIGQHLTVVNRRAREPHSLVRADLRPMRRCRVRHPFIRNFEPIKLTFPRSPASKSFAFFLPSPPTSSSPAPVRHPSAAFCTPAPPSQGIVSVGIPTGWLQRLRQLPRAIHLKRHCPVAPCTTCTTVDFPCFVMGLAARNKGAFDAVDVKSTMRWRCGNS